MSEFDDRKSGETLPAGFGYIEYMAPLPSTALESQHVIPYLGYTPLHPPRSLSNSHLPSLPSNGHSSELYTPQKYLLLNPFVRAQDPQAVADINSNANIKIFQRGDKESPEQGML